MYKSIAIIISLLFQTIFSFATEYKKVILSSSQSFYNQVDKRANGTCNTIFEIRNVFDLKGEEISLPNGSVLLFNGGIIRNGVLVGNSSKIEAGKSCIFQYLRFNGTWDNEYSYPEWFGAIGDGVTDDTNPLYESIENTLGKTLLLENEYLVNNNKLRIARVDSLIIEGGIIVCPVAGLHIKGNSISIRNLKIQGNGNLKSSKLNYSHAGLVLIGDNNNIDNVVVFGINACGINVGGRHIKINNVYSHDNQIGMVVANTVRDIVITNSIFSDNNLVRQSGADGILFQRTASNVIVENCEVNNNGEHGVYFQGQNAVFRNNVVNNNTLDGLKFGSYDDDGYVYTGENEILWVQATEKIPGFNSIVGAKGYGVSNVVIEKNKIENNKGGDGIYFQPSAKDVQIRDNTIVNNDITCTFFNYIGPKARLEDIKNVVVENNLLTGVTPKDGGLSRIYIAASSDVKIVENNCGRINVYAPNKTTAPNYSAYLTNCIIEKNKCSNISINRSQGGIVRNNEMVSFSVNSNCGNLRVLNNKISSQETPILFNVIEEFSNNSIMLMKGALCYETAQYKPKAPKEFRNNIIITSSEENHIIRFYGTVGQSSSFIDNVISCKNSTNPIVISSKQPIIVDNNIVLGKASKKGTVLLMTGSGVTSRDNASNGRIVTPKGNGDFSNMSTTKTKQVISTHKSILNMTDKIKWINLLY